MTHDVSVLYTIVVPICILLYISQITYTIKHSILTLPLSTLLVKPYNKFHMTSLSLYYYPLSTDSRSSINLHENWSAWSAEVSIE